MLKYVFFGFLVFFLSLAAGHLIARRSAPLAGKLTVALSLGLPGLMLVLSIFQMPGAFWVLGGIFAVAMPFGLGYVLGRRPLTRRGWKGGPAGTLVTFR